jgi:hypothetical protein
MFHHWQCSIERLPALELHAHVMSAQLLLEGALLQLRRIIRLTVLALKYCCSTLCQNIGLDKFALE